MLNGYETQVANRARNCPNRTVSTFPEARFNSCGRERLRPSWAEPPRARFQTAMSTSQQLRPLHLSSGRE